MCSVLPSQIKHIISGAGIFFSLYISTYLHVLDFEKIVCYLCIIYKVKIILLSTRLHLGQCVNEAGSGIENSITPYSSYILNENIFFSLWKFCVLWKSVRSRVVECLCPWGTYGMNKKKKHKICSSHATDSCRCNLSSETFSAVRLTGQWQLSVCGTRIIPTRIFQCHCWV